MTDPKALERGLLALQEEWRHAKKYGTEAQRERVRGQYRALHARWMAAKA